MTITIPIEGSKELIKSVLGESYTNIDIEDVVIENSTDEKVCRVSLTTRTSLGDSVIRGSGSGMVDSIFSALKDYFSDEFPSLEGIDLRKFECKAASTSVYSEVVTSAEIKNSHGNTVFFEDHSTSMITSATNICASIAEYFINSDRAYRVLSKALEEAKGRNRVDLIDRYTSELTVIVKSTGYNK